MPSVFEEVRLAMSKKKQPTMSGGPVSAPNVRRGIPAEIFDTDPDYQAALKASELISEGGASRDVMKKLTPSICRTFSACGWGILLSGYPLPQFDVFLQATIPDKEMLNISTGAMILYNEFAEMPEDQRAKIHAVNRRKSGGKGADIILAWQMFVPGGFLGVAFIIGDARHIPSLQEIRLFSLLSNQLAAAIENSRLHRQMYSEITMGSAKATDSETGLPARAHFMEELSQEVKRSTRYDNELSCLLVELSGLSAIKRKHGADVQGRLLGCIGDVMRQTIRDVDVAARLSASQIAIILPETNLTGAKVLARRLLASLEEVQIAPARDNPPDLVGNGRVRLCVGQMKRKDDTAKELVARMKKALKDGKANKSTDQILAAPARTAKATKSAGPKKKA